MLLQKTCNLLCVFDMTLHPQRQGFHPVQGNPGIHRRLGTAQVPQTDRMTVKRESHVSKGFRKGQSIVIRAGFTEARIFGIAEPGKTS